MEKSKKKKTKGSKVRRTAENIIIACLAIIIVVCGWKIFTILREYDQQQDAYDSISEEIQKDGFTGDIDFDALREINPDIVGWLYYEDSPINYPIVQGRDNDKYLTTLFDGSYGSFGTLFADAYTEKPFKQFSTIVYGHHMRNGSMFGTFGRLKDSSYAAEHPQFELITPDGKYHLEIIAFLNQPADSDVYQPNIAKDDRASYLEMIRSHADYVTNVGVSTDDKLVELSTCAYEYKDARYIVSCKMTPWEE